MPDTHLTVFHQVRALCVAALLLVVVSCTASPAKDPVAAPSESSTSADPTTPSESPNEPSTAPDPRAPSTAPTTVTTWDGAVLHTPGLDIPISTHKAVAFGFQNGTTVYADPHSQNERKWHVVHGARDVTLQGQTVELSPRMSSNGQWVVTFTRHPFGDGVSEPDFVAHTKITRHNVRSGKDDVLKLPPATITCCDGGGLTNVVGVTNAGLVILVHNVRNDPTLVWDGAHAPKQIAASPAMMAWPEGVAVPVDLPRADIFDLMAIDPHRPVRRVARISAAPVTWSQDVTKYVAWGRHGYDIGRLRDGKDVKTPLDMPKGVWWFSAWENPTTVVFTDNPRGRIARAALRCDTVTLLCAKTTDPPNTSLPALP